MPAAEVAIGVDFGTTNSVVAVCLNDDVEVLANDIDKRSTPSCVYVRDGEREVGEAALRMATVYPANTVLNVKSILGLPTEALLGPVRLGAVQVEKSGDKNFILKVKSSDRSRTCSAEEFVAMILLELKKTAETQLKTEVKRAVFAVPSYFSVSQRRAIMDAARIAGLDVEDLVNDTTAAAMAYAHDREGKKTVLMVDVGGGGSSVAVVKVETNKVLVQAHSGPRLPGGEDFDAKMVEYLKQSVKNKLDQEVTDPRDCGILRSHWVKAKEKLSRIPQAPIAVFLPGINKEFAETVTRTEFVAQCAELFQEITDGILRTLDLNCKVIEDVDEILLVGGSTRIPYLQSLIQKEFKNKPLSKAINKDESVAEGAALMAAKCVKMMQEVLSLNTEITIDDKSTSLHRNSVLPLRVLQKGDGMPAFEIYQEMTFGNMILLHKFKKPGNLLYEITRSGVLRVVRDAQVELPVRFNGCLNPLNILKLHEKVQMHKRKEHDESQRVESKNALEMLLREVRAKEVSQDDRFRKEAEKLRNDCKDRLEWLAEKTDESAKEYNKIRIAFANRVATLTSKQETERDRMRVTELLRETLLDVITTDIPDDPFSEQASQLKGRCKERLDELAKDQDASPDGLQRELNSLLNEIDNLSNARRGYAAEQRNEQARRSYEVVIITSREDWMKRNQSVASELRDPHTGKIESLCRSAQSWLDAHGRSTDKTIYDQHRESFQKEVSNVWNQLKEDVQKAEQKRRHSYEAFRTALEEALSIQVPSEDDPLYKLTTQYHVHWAEQLRPWLHKYDTGGTQQQFETLADQVKSGVAELRQEQHAEKARVDLKSSLVESLTNLLEEFKDCNFFIELGRRCLNWLYDNPLVSKARLDKICLCVNEVMESLRTAKTHQTNQEREATSASVAFEKAAGETNKLLTMLGFDALPAPPAELSVCTRATWSNCYAPEDFTLAAAADDRMDVDNGSLCGGENGPSACHLVTNGGVVDEQTMLAVLHLFKQTGDERWLQLDPVRSRTPRQWQVMLECLAEELAVDALSCASSAGCMALLLDREVTSDKELVSLSVRYAEPCGRARERLLLVTDIGNEAPQNFAAHLFRLFKELCGRARVNWQKILKYLSAPDCGSFVPFFTLHLREEGCNGFQEVDSISESLDKRVVNACYSSDGLGKDKLVTFFSTVDEMRKKFAVGSKWFSKLREQCNYDESSDPWLTYTSSIKFLFANRKRLLVLVDSASKFDPKERLVMSAIYDKMGEPLYVPCLLAFQEVFAAAPDTSHCFDSSGGWLSFLSDLDNYAVHLSKYAYCGILLRVQDEIRKATGQSYAALAQTRPIVHEIAIAAVDVMKQLLKGFQDFHDLQLCLDSSGTRSHSSLCRHVCEKLSSLKQQADCHSLESLLQLASEGHQPQADLVEALQRAVTVPLIPPKGQRSAVQLRQAVRRTATILPVVGNAVLPVAVCEDTPSSELLRRAAANVLGQCSQLAGAHPGCTMETHM